MIPISQPSITDLEKTYVKEAMDSTWISSAGEYLDRFESEFSSFCNTDYGIAVTNGTVGLHLTLLALGIGVGDEVLVPDFTFIASANTVVHAGATPVFVEIDETHLCMDVNKLEQYLTKRTKAIMPVHVYGHPANMTRINEFARQHNLLVIEDAAEAHGSKVNGSMVGGLGNAGVFSFFANKNLTCGEGGMITTNDKVLADKCRLLRDQAMRSDKKYWHPEIGYNFRMSNLHAAIGCAQLERQHELLSKRKRIYELYCQNLSNFPAFKLNNTCSWAQNSYWMVCLELEGYTYEQRDNLITTLFENGVDSRPYFYPCSAMPYFESANHDVCSRVSKRGINLPTFYDLQESEIDYICDVLIHYLLKRETSNHKFVQTISDRINL